MQDLVTLTVELAFVVVFGQALLAFLRRRDRLQRDVMLVFTAMAVVFVLELWRRTAGPPPALVAGLSAALLLAQPYLTLRLVARIRPVPSWLCRAALVGFAFTALPFALGQTPPAPFLLTAVAVFVAAEVAAAGYLYVEGRLRSGSPRVRLFAAAAATAAFAVAMLAAGAQAAGAATASRLTAPLLALGSAVGYLVAFVPPRWLRRSWSTAAAYAVTRGLLRAPAGEAPEQIWHRYATAVCGVTGADAAIVLLEYPSGAVREVACVRAGCQPAAAHPGDELAATLAAGQPIAAEQAGSPALARRLAARIGARYVTAVPLVRTDAGRGALVLLSTYRGLFAEDDVALLGELGEQASLLAERGGLLTERERLNADLAASVDALSLASKAKSNFLAAMSHELRTPLNAIIGFSDLMDAGDADAAERVVPAEWVRHVRTSGHHLLNLINDILDLAKVEAGRIDLKPEPLALPTVIAEVVTTLRPVSDRKRLRINVDVPPLTVAADRIRFRQMLDNLLSNAIKFTPDRGEIRLRAVETVTEVRISVEDTGIGIAPEDQKRVFEEFTQVGSAEARQAGTGLGLALTRRLVEAHGGSIELRSEAGVGSEFTLCLPASTRTPAVAPDGGPAGSAPGGSGGVLIVEDDPAAAALLATHLAEAGFAAVVATTGQQGLQKARVHQPAAILLDILLPDIDGWQVLRELKDDPATRDVPVIVATVLDEHHVGLALGAVDYLVKPVDPDTLVARLTRYTLLPPPPANATVLAIDDDPATLDLVAATLARHGAHTVTATTGAEGLAQARGRGYDLIICDLALPDLDGFAVIAALGADAATCDIRVLVLTGRDLTAADARLTDGVLGVLHKGEAVPARLRDWLSRVTAPARR